MAQIFGNFIAKKKEHGEHLRIDFSPTSTLFSSGGATTVRVTRHSPRGTSEPGGEIHDSTSDSYVMLSSRSS
jgi:hypothetical protein